MRLIYAFIHQFRNIVNQEIYFSCDYTVSYDYNLPFPQALSIRQNQPSVLSSVIHQDSDLSNVHIVVGKTGAGKTNIFQMIGMTEKERLGNEENRGSYLLLYESESSFLLEPFNILIDDTVKPKSREFNGSVYDRMPESINEYMNLLDSMQMYSFGINSCGKPIDIKTENYKSLEKSNKQTFIFNGFDRNAFTMCPYPEEREDFSRSLTQWQDRELAEFNRTALLCSCRFLKEYIDSFEADNIKRKAAIVIRCDNWANTIKQHIDEKLQAHDYWTFIGRNRADEEEYVLHGTKKRHKPVSVKHQFVHDLWTDFALYLREWISYINMYQEEIDDDSLDSSGTVDVHQEFLDYYFEKEEEEYKGGIDPTILPDYEEISILKRLEWLCMWIDRRGGEYAKGLLWQIADDIKDIGNILNKFDDKYFTNTMFTLPIVDMYTAENRILVEDLFERMEGYQSDDTGIFTKELLPYHFSCISSGEFQLAKVLGGIEEYCVRLSIGDYGNHPNLIYLLDEPENYMHPELCRVFIKKLNELMKERKGNNDIQVLISTHSPFMLSDVLPEQITRLDVDSKGYCVIKNGSEKQYFGANIHTILADGFFLEYTIGEFARTFLQEKYGILKRLYSKGSLTNEEQNQIDEIRNIVPAIGDAIIKQSFEMLLQKFGEIYDQN